MDMFASALQCFRVANDSMNVALLYCNLAHVQRVLVNTMPESSGSSGSKSVVQHQTMLRRAVSYYIQALDNLGTDRQSPAQTQIYDSVCMHLGNTWLSLGLLLERELSIDNVTDKTKQIPVDSSLSHPIMKSVDKTPKSSITGGSTKTVDYLSGEIDFESLNLKVSSDVSVEGVIEIFSMALKSFENVSVGNGASTSTSPAMSALRQQSYVHHKLAHLHRYLIRIMIVIF